MGGLKVHPLPEKRPTIQETSNLAFCPLLLKYSQKGYCSNVACRECGLPKREYKDTLWLCSLCSSAFTALPYWGDGLCEGCGIESAVLILTQLPNED